MRMILVHGINQQGKSAPELLDNWLGALRQTCTTHGLGTFDGLSRIEAAFYGDRLEELSSSGWVSGHAVAMGVEEASDDFDSFAVDALKEMALRMGASLEEIEDEMATTTVPMGSGIHKKWVKATARVIQKISPFRGTIAMRVLAQAHAYVRNQHIHDEVNKLVRPLFEDDEPVIVVAHSLGTVVAYALLREFARNGRPRQSPLLVTLGSPLGIDSIRRSFRKPRTRPEQVQRWVNGADPEDFVALQVELTQRNFGTGIHNYPDFENGHEDPHSITAYLADSRIATEIIRAIP